MVFEGLTLYKRIILNTKTQIILSISLIFFKTQENQRFSIQKL